jgi:hypothetical protein
MAWIYLAESEDSPWLFHRGSDRSPTVKTTDTLRLCFCRGCGGVNFHEPLSGTTSPHSYLACCPEVAESTLSTEGSPARTSALRETERAWRESEADLCLRSLGSFASADLDSFSWKTFQLSLFGGLTEFSWNSMRWGLMRDGQLFQPQKWEPRTLESEFGSWPTPTASLANYDESPETFIARGMKLKAEGRGPRGRLHFPLGMMVRMWPTPLATEGSTKPRHPEKLQRKDCSALRTQGLAEQVGGKLNPTWVEWLMGYPLEWTALEDWATQWFHSQRGKRSKGLQESEVPHDLG